MNRDLTTLFNQAYQLQHQGKLNEAIDLYMQLLSQNPQHIDCLGLIGLAYAQLGHYERAISYLLQAKDLDPTDIAIINNVANAYKKSDQINKAIEYYNHALELKPDYAQAHNNLATIYASQNNYSQALKHYVKAVHAEPDFSAAHFNLGLLLMKNNEIDAAEIQFNNVIALTPQHTEALFYKGVLNLEKNDLIAAEHSFKSALELDNEHVEALANLGVIALKQELKQQAVDYFTKALALDNQHVDARNNLAATFMHHDRFENALMHYDVLLKKDPYNIEYLYNSGVAQMALGHLNEAIILFDQLLELQSQHPAALNNLAAIYLKMNQRETARNYLKQAVQYHPEDHISQHMLNALEGEKQAISSPEYAQNLFNNYALYYEQHMKNTLHYSIPQYINRLMHKLQLPDNSLALDIGCGTGLTGVVIRDYCTHLTGIDIAEKMLAQAYEKGIYDNLIAQDINQFFRDNAPFYNLIVAADVLPYLGTLDTFFATVSEHLFDNGYFIFTIEISDTDPWLLQNTARFSHNPNYIRQLAQENNLIVTEEQQIIARLQNQHPLEVMLYILKRQYQ